MAFEKIPLLLKATKVMSKLEWREAVVSNHPVHHTCTLNMYSTRCWALGEHKGVKDRCPSGIISKPKHNTVIYVQLSAYDNRYSLYLLL